MQENKVDKKRSLYDALTKDNYDLGSFESFVKSSENEDNLKGLYDAITADGYSVGDYESFRFNFRDTASQKGSPDTGVPETQTEADSVFEARVDEWARENGLDDIAQGQAKPYEYKPEVQKHIAGNIPDMFKNRTSSLMDKPLGDAGAAQEGTGEKYDARINAAKRYIESDEFHDRQKRNVGNHVSELTSAISKGLEDIEKKETEHKDRLRKMGGAGRSFHAGAPVDRDDSTLQEYRGQRTYLLGAKELMEESRNIINEAGKKGSTNFFGGLGRGIRDSVFDVDTWSMGITDLIGGLRLKRVIEDYEAGKPLTPEQETLMDAAVTNMAVTAYYASDLGRGYKAGQVTGESLPFMLEMAVNPVSAAGEGIAKSILKYGMKKFGKDAMKKGIAKGTARFAGDAAAAAGMTLTSSAPRVLGGAVDRMTGQVMFDIDRKGNLTYSGRKDSMELDEALGKSFASTFLENQSEMVFDAFNGLGGSIWKAVHKATPGGVDRFIKGAANTKAGKLYRDIKNNALMKEVMKRTKFHGFLGEYAEEVYNNLANVPLGEMTMEQVLDLDNNIDTLLGLAPTSVAFSMLGLGGLVAERASHRKKMEAAFGSMTDSQKEKFAELERLSKERGNRDIREFIKATMADAGLTQEQRRQEIEYAFDIATQNALDDVAREQVEEQAESRATAREEGAAVYSTGDTKAMREAAVREEFSRARLLDAGADPAMMENLSGADDATRAASLEAMDGNTRELFADWLKNNDRKTAVEDAMDEAHAPEVDAAERQILDMSSNGMVNVVNLGRFGGNGRTHGIVVNGIDANGQPVSGTNMIMVVPVGNTPDGSPDLTSFDVRNAVAVTMEKDMTIVPVSGEDALRSMLSGYQAEADAMEAPQIMVGATYQTLNESGQPASMTIVGIDPTAGIVRTIGNEGTAMQDIPLESFRQMVAAAEQAPVAQEYAAKEAASQAESEAAQKELMEGSFSQEVLNLTPTLNERITIEGRPGSITAIGADGITVEFNDKGERFGATNITMDEYYAAKQEQFEASSPVRETESLQTDAPSLQTELQTEMQSEPQEEVKGEAFEAKKTDETVVIPSDKKGNPLYHTVPVEVTLADLRDGLDQEEVATFVDKYKKAADKALKDAQKKKPKIGTNKAKYLKEKKEWEASVTEMKAIADYWVEVEKRNNEGEMPTVAESKPVNQGPVADFATGDKAKKEISSFTERIHSWLTPENMETAMSMTKDEILEHFGNTPEPIGYIPVKYLSIFGEDMKDNRLYCGKGYFIDHHINHHPEMNLDEYDLLQDVINNPDAIKDLGNTIAFTKMHHRGFAVLVQLSKENGRIILHKSMFWRDKGMPYKNKKDVEVMPLVGGRSTISPTDDSIAGRLLSALNGNTKIANYLVPEKDLNDFLDEYRQIGNFESALEEPKAPVSNPSLPKKPEKEAPFKATSTEMAASPAAKEVLARTEPETLEELASALLGKTIFLQQTGERGARAMSGHGFNDAKHLRGLWRKAENGGLTIEKAGEMVELAAREMYPEIVAKAGLENDNTGMSGTNAVLSVLQGARTIGDIYHYIENNRLDEAQRAMQAEDAYEEELREAWTQEHFHMSYDEYMLYEEVAEEIIVEKAFSEEEKVKYISNFVDEFNSIDYGRNEIESRVQGTAGVNEQGGTDGQIEGGGEILHAAQPVHAGRTGRTEEESSETDGSVAGQNGASQTEQSGNEVTARIAQARSQVDQSPTDAQKEAGNYKKGHINIDGYDITIENPKGGTRSGTDKNGKKWSITMNNDYGYIRGTEAVDGDHIDVFLSDNPATGNVFVVDQLNEDGSFDESKVMYGFNSLEEARAAYLSNYSEGWEIRIGAITEVTKDEFKKWVDSSHRKTKAFSEYKSVTPVDATFEVANAQRMREIEERLTEIENRKAEIEDDLSDTGRDMMIDSLLEEESYELSQEQAELEAEYSGLKSINQESREALEEEGFDVPFQQTIEQLENATPAQQLATRWALEALNRAGIKVTMATKEMVEAIEDAKNIERSKRKAPETVSVPQKEHHPTVVSSASGAKILKDLDLLAKDYEEKTIKRPISLIGDIAKVLGMPDKGRSSQYGLYETKNGRVISIRLSNHNATVSNFDNVNESEGISIIITSAPNEGITNDGFAHIVEFYYNAIDLRKAEGNPLVQIIQSLKQTLYSGEYKDTTGLATREEVNAEEFMFAPSAPFYSNAEMAVLEGQPMFQKQGTLYGWADGKDIFLTEAGINPNTPIHEYTHLWAKAMMQKNPKGWTSVKNLLKNTPQWDAVLNDPNYSSIKNNENMVAGEVLSRISGKENSQKMVAEAQKAIDESYGNIEKAAKVDILRRLQEALKKFWNWVGVELFGIEKFESVEQVTDRVLYDFVSGTDLGKRTKGNVEKQILGEKGAANLDKKEKTTFRMDNLEVAKRMEAALEEKTNLIERRDEITSSFTNNEAVNPYRKDKRLFLTSQTNDKENAKRIRMATGWERGADGKWRYEVMDLDTSGIESKLNERLNEDDRDDKEKTASAVVYSDEIPAITDAYPDFNVDIIVNVGNRYDNTGTYKPGFEGDSYYMGYTPTIEINAKTIKDVKTLLVHELQHAIQAIEGFAEGGSPYMENPNAWGEYEDLKKRLAELDNLVKDERAKIIDKYKAEYNKGMDPASEMRSALSDLQNKLGRIPTDSELMADKRYADAADQQELRDRIENEINEATRGYENERERIRQRMDYLDSDSGNRLGYEGYMKLAGEVEARNASSRIRMNENDRREFTLEETEDVPRDEQIEVYDSINSASVVSDEAKIAELESSEKRTGYRNVVLNPDGSFGSPMASKLGKTSGAKKQTRSFEMGKWEQSEENPELADENGKIDLIKPDGKKVSKVDYNPYIHNRLNKVNSQFRQAWERPDLVYIETEVPVTDLESGYHADKAKLPVGVHKWNGGDLMLSRYDKPVRIVPWEEVADDWVEQFKDRGVEFDIVPPALLPILSERGVKILPPHKGMGKACNDAYKEFKQQQDSRTLPDFRLRKLEEGEVCGIERTFAEQGMFNFSAGEKIESYEDVAYIFRSLEDEAIENTFVALIKDGKPTILHLGMGTATHSTLDQQAVIVAIERIKPDEVYMVHNHPSGNLRASRQDVQLLSSMKKAYGPIVKDGIIIDLRSGKYTVFDETNYSYGEMDPSVPEKEVPVKTYMFSKRVFAKDFNIEELITARSSEFANLYAQNHGLIAALTSSQRLGERDKMSLLVVNQSSKIVGNVFLNHTEITPSNSTQLSKDIAYYVSSMGGQFGILFGRMDVKQVSKINEAVQILSAGSVRMLDALSVDANRGYVSAADEGVMEDSQEYERQGNTFSNVLQLGNFSIPLSDEAMASAKALAETMPKGKTFPADFPDAVVHTTLFKLKEFGKLYDKAKSGDMISAIDLVRAVVKPAKIEAIAQTYPNAIVAYPHAIESAGKNKIPGAYALMLEQAGLKIDEEICQTNKVFHTGADDVSRLTKRARFDGNVVEGADYILIDDQISSGATLRDMKNYIESKGGNVVLFSSLAASYGGTKIAHQKNVIKKLNKTSITDEQLQKYGIAHNTGELTNSEASRLCRMADKRGTGSPSQGQEGFPGVREGVLGQASNEEIDPDILFQRVHHGSAATFDAFDKNFIGSGEGQAVMGHGFYVTTSKGTAEYYADVASNMRRKVVQEGGYTFNGKVERDRGLVSAYELLKNNDFDADRAIEAANHRIEIIKRRKGAFANTSITEKAIEYLQAEKGKKGSIGYQDEIIEKPSRIRYEVEIPDDTGSNYLDLDKVVSQKHKNEAKKRMLALLNIGEDSDYWMRNRDVIEDEWRNVNKKDATGDVLRATMEQFVSQEDVADIFADMGYVGSKAQGSDGTTYIIYNGKDIEIKDNVSFQRKDGENVQSDSKENIIANVKVLADQLNTPVEIIEKFEDIPSSYLREQIEKGERYGGWYHRNEGKVYLYLPEAESVATACQTVWHEVIAHHGLRQLFGKHFDYFIDQVYFNAPESMKNTILDMSIEEGLSVEKATEEYIADLAQRGPVTKTELSLWEKIRGFFLEMLSRAGVELRFEVKDSDIRYVLWRSQQNLENGTLIDVAKDTVMRAKMGIGKFAKDQLLFEKKSKAKTKADLRKEISELKDERRKLLGEISELKKKVREYRKGNKEEFENNQRAVISFITQRLTKEAGETIGKERMNAILRLVSRATTADDMSQALRYIEQIIYSSAIDNATRKMNKLIKTKLQGLTPRGVAKGVVVDEATRRLFDSIRATFKDLLTTSIDSELRAVRGQIIKLGKQIKETPESEKTTIDALTQKQDDLKARRGELEDERKSLESARIKDTVKSLEKRKNELSAALDAHIDKGETWTQEMQDEYDSIPLREKLAEIREMQAVLDQVFVDAMNKRRNAYGLKGEARRKMLAESEELETNYTFLQEELLNTINEVSEDLASIIKDGKSRLAMRNKALTERRREIVNMGIKAVKKNRVIGPNDILTDKEKFHNWFDNSAFKGFYDFMTAPMNSFNYMLKYIDNNHTIGKGDLYNHFMKSEAGALEAGNRYYEGLKSYVSTMEEKAKEIFGKPLDKVMKEARKEYEGVVHKVRTHDSNNYNEGDKYPVNMTKGNALYVWLTWRQEDGRVKLVNDGWTEASIAEIEELIGEKYMEFGRWITDEFFPDLREEKYNPTHVELFGTSMERREHYFPFKIDIQQINEKGELGESYSGMPSTTTGNIIKRTINASRIDTSKDAFELMYKYGNDMESWDAYARLRRDLNFLRGSMAFRNYLEANEKGLFEKFIKSAEVAVKAFDNSGESNAINDAMSKVVRSTAGSVIAYRLNTAMKQVLSFPAFLAYSGNLKYVLNLTKYMLNWKGNYKWAKENLPAFRQRVDSGDMGYVGMKDEGVSKIFDKITEIGMVPNQFVDALTCAAGARAVYDFEYQKALRRGLGEDEAKRLAQYNAEIVFNESQQSSRDEFVSPIQMSRSALIKSLMNFQNSNIGYQRIVGEGVLEIMRAKRVFNQDLDAGMDPKEAKAKYLESYVRGARKVSIAAAVLPGLWYLGSSGIVGVTPQLIASLSGGYDEDDEPYLSDEETAGLITSIALGTIAGTTGGQALASIIQGHDYNPMPFVSEATSVVKDIIENGINRSMALRISKYAGLNLETFENIYIGIEGVVRDGRLDLIDFMYMINSPASQRREMALELYKKHTPYEFMVKNAEAQKLFKDYRASFPYAATDKTGSKVSAIEKEYVIRNLSKKDRETYEKEKELKKLERSLNQAEDKLMWHIEHPEYNELKSVYGTDEAKDRVTKLINQRVKEIFGED